MTGRTADGPAGQGAVCDRRVRELHVASTDFKASSVRTFPWESARRGSDTVGGHGRRRGAGRFQCDCFNSGRFDQVFLPKL
jgi:hypothetical protein